MHGYVQWISDDQSSTKVYLEKLGDIITIPYRKVIPQLRENGSRMRTPVRTTAYGYRCSFCHSFRGLRNSAGRPLRMHTRGSQELPPQARLQNAAACAPRTNYDLRETVPVTSNSPQQHHYTHFTPSYPQIPPPFLQNLTSVHQHGQHPGPLLRSVPSFPFNQPPLLQSSPSFPHNHSSNNIAHPSHTCFAQSGMYSPPAVHEYHR